MILKYRSVDGCVRDKHAYHLHYIVHFLFFKGILSMHLKLYSIEYCTCFKSFKKFLCIIISNASTVTLSNLKIGPYFDVFDNLIRLKNTRKFFFKLKSSNKLKTFIFITLLLFIFSNNTRETAHAFHTVKSIVSRFTVINAFKKGRIKNTCVLCINCDNCGIHSIYS